VLGNLNTFGVTVKPDNVLRSVRKKTKERAFAGVGDELSVPSSWRFDPYAAAEGTELLKVVHLVDSNAERGRYLILGWEGILDTEVVVKSIRPKFGIKVGAEEHGTDGIGDSEVCAFDRTILIRRVGTGGADFVSTTFKELADLRVLVEFTTLVEVHILIRALRSMVFQEVTKPVDWRGFGDAGITVKTTGVVVSHQDPASFAVETNVIFAPFVIILGLHAREGEINGKALIGADSNASSVGSGRFLLLLGTDASRALFEDRVHVFELRDALYKSMRIVEVVVTGVAETLVPKEALSSGLDGCKRCVPLDVFMERKTMERKGNGFQLLTQFSKFSFLVGVDIENGGAVACGSKVRVGFHSLSTGGVRRGLGMRCRKVRGNKG